MNSERIARNNNALHTATPMSGRLLQRKCACGQHMAGGIQCAACAETKELNQPLQAKLQIGDTNDTHEQEAGRVADQVIRMPQLGTRKASPYRQTISLVQRRTTNGNGLGRTDVPAMVEEVLSSSGQPLNQATRAYMEPRFGADFSNVRVHNGTQAANAARLVNARAFTVEHNVVFGTGEYSPDTLTGRKLFAHELTHVVQQSGGSILSSKESHAEESAKRSTIQQVATPVVQRRSDAITSDGSGSVGPKNFASQNLAGKNFRRQDLRKANFSRADLTGAKFNWSDLDGANFNNARLRNARFINARAPRATFREADMEETNLRGADLFAADLGKARLFRSNLRRATLLAANLRGANMIGARLRGADLTGATVTSRDLLGADTRGAIGLSPKNEKSEAEDVAKANNQLLSTLAGAWEGEIKEIVGDILFTPRGSVGDLIGTFRSRRYLRVFHLLVQVAPEGSRRHVLQWNDGFGGHGTGWLERSIGGESLRGSLHTGPRARLGNDISLIRTAAGRRDGKRGGGANLSEETVQNQ